MTEQGLASLELEIRKIPGVVGVGVERRGSSFVLHLLVSPGAPADRLRRRAGEVARSYVDAAVGIEIEGTSAAAPPGAAGRERARILAVRQAGSEVEVHLSRSGARTVGRGGGHGPYGAVAATLEALEGLGAAVPFELAGVASLAYGPDHAVVVLMSPGGRGQGSTQRMGAARGSTVGEAACRATLHALNRHLESEGAFGGEGGGRSRPDSEPATRRGPSART